MFAFEGLEIWQSALVLAGEIYDATDLFPRREQFALSQRLTRAVVSIGANIAEGKSKSSSKKFSRYIEITYGFLCELVAELHVAKRRSYIKEDQFKELYTQAEHLGKMLSKFRATLETSWIKNSV